MTFKLSVKKYLFFFLICLSLTVASASMVSASNYTGWKTRNDNRYYYVKGKKVTGYKKINGYYYFFSSRGRMLRNRMVGNKTIGYSFVSNSGIRIKDPVLKQAITFVKQNSRTSDTKLQRLHQCFLALCKYPYRNQPHDPFSAEEIRKNAAHMFSQRNGDCVSYASAFAYIARALGFEARVARGGVTASSYRDLNPHSWCEVKIDNTWKMVDCSMQNAHWEVSLYLVPRDQYPFRLRCDKTLGLYFKKDQLVIK